MCSDFHLLYDALFLSESEVVMKPIICNHGNNSAAMPLIKSCCTPGVLEPDQCLCWSHRDRQCLQHIFPGKVFLPSIYLSSEETHLFRFPAEIQCGIFSFQRATLWLFSRDYEVTTTTDRRWRPHETQHQCECTWRGTAHRCSPGKKMLHIHTHTRNHGGEQIYCSHIFKK